MISPLDIRQHNFGKGMRGYNTDEVRAFLQSLSTEWEQALDENKRLKSELDKTQERLKNFTDMEDIMRKTLYQAEQSSKAAVEAAARDAQLKIAEAEQRAKAIIAQAELERQKEEMKLQELVDKKAAIIGQLKSFLKSELDHIGQYEENQVRRSTPRSEPVVIPQRLELEVPPPVITAPVEPQKTAQAPKPEPVAEAPRMEVTPMPKALERELPLFEPEAQPAAEQKVERTQTPAEKAQSFFDKIAGQNQKSAIISELSKGL